MRKRGRRGYSLIEVLWVMALVSFLLAGMADLILGAIRAGRKSEETARKAALLGAALEGFKSLPYGNAALAEGDYEAAALLFPGGRSVRTAWHISAGAERLKRIDFRLFLEGEEENAIRSALLISEALGF